MTGPKVRTVNQLTGEVAGRSAFFRALSEADQYIRQLDDTCEEYIELRVRCDELLIENGELRRERDLLLAAINAAAGRHGIL
jgi:predicted nuclease with TOPRIM domain